MVQNDNPGLIKSALKFGSKFIDYKMGRYGAIVMATIVFSINYFSTYYLFWSIVAALKQGTYTFFFGGIIMKMSENLAVSVKNRTMALIAAVIIPSTVSLCLTFGLHSLKGTPKPFESTIPTAIFVIPSTAVWGFMRRKRHDKLKIVSEIAN
jgi:hypothetical protein